MTHLRVSWLSHTSTDQIFLSKATDYFLPNIKLLSANAFSLEESKICGFGKESRVWIDRMVDLCRGLPDHKILALSISIERIGRHQFHAGSNGVISL